uniref:Uncharacterized protein n=1 Tax=Kalanchoe fedtschenkoi TaxID=63787 RepID=A0A7N0V874_KALFE
MWLTVSTLKRSLGHIQLHTVRIHMELKIFSKFHLSRSSRSDQYGSVTFSSASAPIGPNHHLVKDGSLGDESKATSHQQEVERMAQARIKCNSNNFLGLAMHFRKDCKHTQLFHQLIGQIYWAGRFHITIKMATFMISLLILQLGQTLHPYIPILIQLYHRGVELSASIPVNHSWAPHLAPGVLVVYSLRLQILGRRYSVVQVSPRVYYRIAYIQ